MQRDEFLPLRVIRQVISQGGGGARRPRIVNPDEGLTLDQLLIETDAEQQFVRELHDFGLLEAANRDRSKPYTRADAEIVMLCQRLARYGVAARNLRAFRSRWDAKPACSSRFWPRRCVSVEPRSSRGGPAGARLHNRACSVATPPAWMTCQTSPSGHRPW